METALLIVDDGLTLFGMDREESSNLLTPFSYWSDIEQAQYPVIIVTSRGHGRMPRAVHVSHRLGPPSVEAQISRWQEWLPLTPGQEASLRREALRRPMSLGEIDAAARKASVRAMVRDGLDCPDFHHVLDVLQEGSGQQDILFGAPLSAS